MHTHANNEWLCQAACTSGDPDLFFPTGTTGPALDQLYQAQRVCHACPVRSNCLEWANRIDADFGVWGGLSENDRRTRARPGPPAAPSPLPRSANDPRTLLALATALGQLDDTNHDQLPLRGRTRSRQDRL